MSGARSHRSLLWKRSRFCGGGNTTCVEVCHVDDADLVLLRDSKEVLTDPDGYAVIEVSGPDFRGLGEQFASGVAFPSVHSLDVSKLGDDKVRFQSPQTSVKLMFDSAEVTAFRNGFSAGDFGSVGAGGGSVDASQPRH
ncbi:MAG: DUF397 domain-containing protein [bacterium]|nr:DUF397 domain-containing protein [Actinomycetes bacterium]MCP4963716.1 DUF397 domain-containing protein [bacterium]